MDKRDLINLMRHAFLLGFNTGHLGDEIESDKRDRDLAEFIEDYDRDGYMDYDQDPGSHNCSELCK